jgi:long-chain acyl-CoA synthetase
MLVHQLLEDSARRTPEAVALIEPRRTTTYRDLDKLANRFANLFRSSGVKPGDRVVIALDNSAEFVGGYFGAMKAGAVAVPLPPGARSDRLDKAVLDCAPAACVVDSTTLAELSPGHPVMATAAVFALTAPSPHATVTRGARSLRAELDAASDQHPSIRVIDLDLACIIYTSGSTGEPRGVMRMHRNVVANTRSIVEYLGLSAADRVMCVLPFSYVYGLSLLHTHLAVGGSVVIENRFVFPNVALKAMREHRVTGFAGVPSTFALLLHRSDLAATSLPDLRYVTQAGGGMAPPRILEWLEQGPKVPFFVMYGATEAAARLTYLDPARLHDKLGSIGRPIPNVEVLVVRDDGQLAGPGEVGELVARGSNIACGYWNNMEETQRRFGPLGYRTGDLGYADEDGFLFLVGRRHDMMKVGAHRVGAKEIEDVLSACPGVHEAAVIPIPHEILGEVPAAFVSPRTPGALDIETLQAFCRSRLPAYKVPHQFLLRDELPKIGAVGKIDKTALRAAVAAQ